MTTCIFCGCVTAHGCIVRFETQPEDVRAAIVTYYRRRRESIPRHLRCSWISLNPPVCSNPECVKQHQAAIAATTAGAAS